MNRQCPNCKSQNFITKNKDGFIVCTGCGLVVDKTFGDEPDHPPPVPVNPKKNYYEITDLCEKLAIFSREFIDTVSQLYERSQDLEQKPGIKSKAIIAASIYLTSNELHKGLQQDKICNVCKITSRELSRAIEFLKPVSSSTNENRIEDVAQKLANDLRLHIRVVQCIHKFGSMVRENNILPDSKSKTRAGAIILFVLSKVKLINSTNPKFYQPVSAIEKVCGVKESTLKKSVQSFVPLENAFLASNEYKQMLETIKNPV